MSAYSELYDSVRFQLGRPNQDLESAFLREMKQAQIRLESRQTLPSFMLKRAPVATVPANTYVIPGYPPDDYISVSNDNSLVYFLDGDPFPVKRLLTETELLSTRANENLTGAYYFIFGKSEMTLAHAAEIDIDYQLTYYAKEPVLDGTTDNQWITEAGDYIAYSAGTKIAMGLRDKEKIQLFTQLESEARIRLFHRAVADEIEDVELIFGGAD